MSKKFTYEIITECGYIENSDEYDYWGDEFEYEVDYRDVEDAIVDIVASGYFNGDKKEIKEFLDDYDLYDYLAETLEDELHDYFEEEAFEWKKQCE